MDLVAGVEDANHRRNKRIPYAKKVRVPLHILINPNISEGVSMSQSGSSEDFVIQNSWSRVGGLALTYYSTAETAFSDYLLECSSPVPYPIDDEDPTAHLEQGNRLTIAGVKTIIFSAMCIEAAAFDFAAINLGDSYAAQYLDKLDLVSKWVVVPKLVSGRSLLENGPAINSVRILVRARNALVHQKSLPYDQRILGLTLTLHKILVGKAVSLAYSA